MEFTSQVQIQKIPNLVQEFFEHVLPDEKPLFVGDEATVFDVSMSPPDELIKRFYQAGGALFVGEADVDSRVPHLSAKLKGGAVAFSLHLSPKSIPVRIVPFPA